MTLQQLNYIITISEIGSINRAAEKLYVSQPSLTSAIKELEKELGIVLFNRTARGVTLTAEGVDFLPYARQVYGDYLNLLEKYGKVGERKQRFGVSCQHYSFAVKAFVEGRGNCVIGTRGGDMVETPIEEALQMKKHLQMDRYQVLETVSVTAPHVMSPAEGR